MITFNIHKDPPSNELLFFLESDRIFAVVPSKRNGSSCVRANWVISADSVILHPEGNSAYHSESCFDISKPSQWPRHCIITTASVWVINFWIMA